MGIPHVAIDLRLRYQRSNRVHDHDIHGTGTHHRLTDLKCLLSAVRLGDIEVIDIHTDIPRIDRIQCMLRIDETCNPAALLNLCNRMQRHGGLTA